MNCRSDFFSALLQLAARAVTARREAAGRTCSRQARPSTVFVCTAQMLLEDTGDRIGMNSLEYQSPGLDRC